MRFISQDWGSSAKFMYLNSLYLCSAYRKLYCNLLYSFTVFCLLVYWFSFVLPSPSSFLYLQAFLVYPLDGQSVHPTSREEHWPTWAWSSCPGRSYRDLGGNGRKPLFYILFGQIALSHFTLRGFFHYFPFNLLWGNIVGLQAERAENFTKFTKFSSIFSIGHCCHSWLRIRVLMKLSCLKRGNFDLDLCWLMS